MYRTELWKIGLEKKQSVFSENREIQNNNNKKKPGKFQIKRSRAFVQKNKGCIILKMNRSLVFIEMG